LASSIGLKRGSSIPWPSASWRSRRRIGRCIFVGHWGWQQACESRGWRPAAPGTVLPEGSLLLLPLPPRPGAEFYRPTVWELKLPGDDAAERIETFVAEDSLMVQTVPNLYTGGNPIGRRTGPRMVVAVYRIKKSWRV
jgi:hypothetical protein